MPTISDDQLIALLEDRREEVAKILNVQSRYHWENYTKANSRFEEMAKEIAEAMKAHPEFSSEKHGFFLNRVVPCSTGLQSYNLLGQAACIGSKAAFDWYKKVLSTPSAHVDVISEVYGLLVRKPIEFSNGVRLVPLTELIDTPHARSLASRGWTRHGIGIPMFPAAAVLTFRDVVRKFEHSDGQGDFLAAVETIRRTITALTLSETNTPTTGISWTDFHDIDLTATSFGAMWQSATYDGKLPDFPIEVDPAGPEWAEKVLALSGEVAAKCNLALARLNLARRRQTPGDKAIDGCIAFEALLSDRQQGDLTYKLKLRVARLLGNNYDERIQISGKVGKFYSLRSKVVHGQSKGSSDEDRQAAEDGLNLALTTIRKIVHDGKIPDLKDLELGPK